MFVVGSAANDVQTRLLCSGTVTVTFQTNARIPSDDYGKSHFGELVCAHFVND